MWKLTLRDIYTTPKRLKTERDCSHRQLFRPFWDSSVWRNNQRKLWRKKSAHSDFSPDLELSTPTESRHTTCLLGGVSPSVKLMSRRENKGLAIFKKNKMYHAFWRHALFVRGHSFSVKIFDRSRSGCQLDWGRETIQAWAFRAGAPSPLVSLSRAHSFLRPLLPSACYTGYCKMTYWTWCCYGNREYVNLLVFVEFYDLASCHHYLINKRLA